MHLIEGLLEKQLKQIIQKRLPAEAVGLILNDGTVVELTNLAEVDSNFQVTRKEILEALSTESSIENVALWHSHPNGGVGPSRTDMVEKTPLPYHLVLSVVNSDLVATWY